MTIFESIKKLFEKRSKYSVSDYTVIHMQGPEWKKWDTNKATKEGFTANGWVYRSIQIIAQVGSSVDFVVYNSDNEILWEHPLTILLNNPQPSSGFFSKSVFFETIITWLYLSGIAPIHKILNGQGLTQELNLISPDRITYIRKNGVPVDYGVDLQGSYSFVKDERVNFDTIIPLRFPDPSDPYSGISPLMVSGKLVDIMTDNKAFDKASSQNRGVMDGILSFGASIPEQQMSVIREKIRETFRQNRESGYPNVLGGSPSYVRMGLNQVEMDLISQNKANREEILATFGMPPQILGLEGSIKYDNFMSSMRILGATTITPLLDKITDAFTTSFKNELNPGEWVGYDSSGVTALSQDEEQKALVARRYYDIGIPVSQLNSKLQLGFEAFEGWDIPFNGLKDANEQRKKNIQTPITKKKLNNVL